jgi:hypothetical protein
MDRCVVDLLWACSSSASTPETLLRCQPTTVAGSTRTRARRQPRQERRSHIQKTRSRSFRRTVPFCRCRTMSCCLRARFSSARFRLLLNPDTRAHAAILIQSPIATRLHRIVKNPAISGLMGFSLPTGCFRYPQRDDRACVRVLLALMYANRSRVGMQRLLVQVCAGGTGVDGSTGGTHMAGGARSSGAGIP